ncbi:hypothetical protein [Oceanobacillus sp. CAU 1775]
MKKYILLMILLFFIVGCSQKDEVIFEGSSTLVVEKRFGNESSSSFEVINEISDKDTIQEIVEIFQEIKWETHTEYNMPEPDYKLATDYHIWITPRGDRLEIININNSYYVRLSAKDSEELFELMTGKELP